MKINNVNRFGNMKLKFNKHRCQIIQIVVFHQMNNFLIIKERVKLNLLIEVLPILDILDMEKVFIQKSQILLLIGNSVDQYIYEANYI